MCTVSKQIADDLIAGKYPEDHAVKIVEYNNAWGGVGYGVIFAGQRLDYYAETTFVRNPRVYWELK